MKNSLINQIKTLLGMEVKLETMKLSDGVTVLEAEMFEAGNEVFVVTEDEQKIALPIGEYELEDGRILVVVEDLLSFNDENVVKAAFASKIPKSSKVKSVS